MKLKVDITTKTFLFHQGDVFWLIQNKVNEENFAMFLLEDFKGISGVWKTVEKF